MEDYFAGLTTRRAALAIELAALDQKILYTDAYRRTQESPRGALFIDDSPLGRVAIEKFTVKRKGHVYLEMTSPEGRPSPLTRVEWLPGSLESDDSDDDWGNSAQEDDYHASTAPPQTTTLENLPPLIVPADGPTGKLAITWVAVSAPIKKQFEAVVSGTSRVAEVPVSHEVVTEKPKRQQTHHSIGQTARPLIRSGRSLEDTIDWVLSS